MVNKTKVLTEEEFCRSLKALAENQKNREVIFSATIYYLAKNEPEKADYYFNMILTKIKKFKSININNGLLLAAFCSKIFFVRYGSYKLLTEQLNQLLHDCLEQYTMNNSINIYDFDILVGPQTIVNYLLDSNLRDSNIILNYEKNVAKRILNEEFLLLNMRNSNEEGRRIEKDYVDIGAAHGITGIIPVLNNFYKIFPNQQILDSIDKIFSILQQLSREDNNIIYLPGYLTIKNGIFDYSIDAAIEQYHSWCYGTLGILTMLNSSPQIIKTKYCFDKKKKHLLNQIINQPVKLRKGNYFFCHGSIGIVRMLDLLLPNKEIIIKKKEIVTKPLKVTKSDTYNFFDGIPSYFINKNILNYNERERYIFDKLYLLK
jgi:hypothetical protein